MVEQPIVEVRDLCKTFSVKHAGGVSTLQALNGVSFDIMRSENAGLVGESGSGKTSAGSRPGRADPGDQRIRHLVRPPYHRSGCQSSTGRRAVAAATGCFRIHMLRSIRGCGSAMPSPNLSISRAVIRGAIATTGWRSCLNWWDCPKPVSSAIRMNSPVASAQRIVIARALALNPQFVVLRRAGVGAGRIDAGPDRQSAARPAGSVRAQLPVHRRTIWRLYARSPPASP